MPCPALNSGLTLLPPIGDATSPPGAAGADVEPPPKTLSLAPPVAFETADLASLTALSIASVTPDPNLSLTAPYIALPAAPIALPPTKAPSVSSPVLKSSLPLANV